MGQSKRTYESVHSRDVSGLSGEEQIFDMQSFAEQLFFNPLHTNQSLVQTLNKLNQDKVKLVLPIPATVNVKVDPTTLI